MNTFLDFDQFKWLLSLIQWILLGGVGLFSYLTNKDAANQREVNKLTERVRALESQLETMPKAADVHNLVGDVRSMQSSIESMQRTFESVNRSIERLTDYLLTKS